MENGSQFLHERNPDFQASPEVEGVVDYLRAGGENIPNQPDAKISAYLGFLAEREYVNDGILTGDPASIDRQIDAHVIAAAEVPEGYFDLQRRIAREQGHGDVQITPEMRKQMIEAVQADQRAGLGKWVEYMGGNDGGYPDWFKNYTWTSVTKLGNYDKEKAEFGKRSRGTTAPYPELNREALAYVYDKLNKTRIEPDAKSRSENLAQESESLQKLLNSANFGKLYAHAAVEVMPGSPELRENIKGSWTKYDQSSDPRTARRLAQSLQGHGTGWCTAGESTAATQLSGGDFYVYYTRDEDGRDSVPRVAIRMAQGKVAEVRGVNAAQELENEMADITAEQLQDLPGGEEYIRKAQDMKQLTAIEKKTAANPNVSLTADELRFLYELDHEIQGFGYKTDPRISEIRRPRGDRDKPELAHILPETIREQVKGAFEAYKTVAEQLGGKQRLFRKGEATLSTLSPNELERLFTAKDKEWQANGVYDYLVDQLVENGARFTLLATPNIEATKDQIVTLAKNFGQEQPYETYVADDMYRRGRYSAQEWSGSYGNEPVRFSLMPSNYDAELGYRSADEQRKILAAKQTSQPNLNLRVPSLLDSISYWYALRAQGDKLKDSSTFKRTYVRHIDLNPQRLGGWSFVPCSCVRGAGRPYLDRSNAGNDCGARVAVG
ncbi:MAG: hypothetical protein ACREGA_03830 [Candidatus Saccharimonadales bacterium]